MRAEQGGRGRQLKLKENGKKERRESLSKGQEAWSKQRPPVIFKTQFLLSGIVTESQLGSWPPWDYISQVPLQPVWSRDYILTNEMRMEVMWASTWLWRKSLASVPSSSVSHGLFVAVVWPGFVYTEEDRVTPRGCQSNKTEGTVVRSSFFQPQWEAKQTQPRLGGREKAECFLAGESAGLVGEGSRFSSLA